MATKTLVLTQNLSKMNLQELFQKVQKPLLNIYFSAGFPQIDSLPVLLESLESAGADMVEIGIPYSDPLSDGPIIQNSNSIALVNGITLELIFQQLESSSSQLPKIMMGYFNSVLQFGVEEFCKRCFENDISGVILPDLPLEIYQRKYQDIFEKYELSFILLITPKTTEERIRYIDKHSTSFIYAVSSAGTTGTKKGIQGAEKYLQRIQSLNLKTPVMVGFNISTPEDFQFASKYTRGGIIGSAFIKYIENSNNLSKDTHQFINYIKS